MEAHSNSPPLATISESMDLDALPETRQLDSTAGKERLRLVRMRKGASRRKATREGVRSRLLSWNEDSSSAGRDGRDSGFGDWDISAGSDSHPLTPPASVPEDGPLSTSLSRPSLSPPPVTALRHKSPSTGLQAGLPQGLLSAVAMPKLRNTTKDKFHKATPGQDNDRNNNATKLFPPDRTKPKPPSNASPPARPRMPTPTSPAAERHPPSHPPVPKKRHTTSTSSAEPAVSDNISLRHESRLTSGASQVGLTYSNVKPTYDTPSTCRHGRNERSSGAVNVGGESRDTEGAPIADWRAKLKKSSASDKLIGSGKPTQHSSPPSSAAVTKRTLTTRTSPTGGPEPMEDTPPTLPLKRAALSSKRVTASPGTDSRSHNATSSVATEAGLEESPFNNGFASKLSSCISVIPKPRALRKELMEGRKEEHVSPPPLPEKMADTRQKNEDTVRPSARDSPSWIDDVPMPSFPQDRKGQTAGPRVTSDRVPRRRDTPSAGTSGVPVPAGRVTRIGFDRIRYAPSVSKSSNSTDLDRDDEKSGLAHAPDKPRASGESDEEACQAVPSPRPPPKPSHLLGSGRSKQKSAVSSRPTKSRTPPANDEDGDDNVYDDMNALRYHISAEEDDDIPSPPMPTKRITSQMDDSGAKPIKPDSSSKKSAYNEHSSIGNKTNGERGLVKFREVRTVDIETRLTAEELPAVSSPRSQAGGLPTANLSNSLMKRFNKMADSPENTSNELQMSAEGSSGSDSETCTSRAPRAQEGRVFVSPLAKRTDSSLAKSTTRNSVYGGEMSSSMDGIQPAVMLRPPKLGKVSAATSGWRHTYHEGAPASPESSDGDKSHDQSGPTGSSGTSLTPREVNRWGSLGVSSGGKDHSRVGVTELNRSKSTAKSTSTSAQPEDGPAWAKTALNKTKKFQEIYGKSDSESPALTPTPRTGSREVPKRDSEELVGSQRKGLLTASAVDTPLSGSKPTSGSPILSALRPNRGVKLVEIEADASSLPTRVPGDTSARSSPATDSAVKSSPTYRGTSDVMGRTKGDKREGFTKPSVLDKDRSNNSAAVPSWKEQLLHRKQESTDARHTSGENFSGKEKGEMPSSQRASSPTRFPLARQTPFSRGDGSNVTSRAAFAKGDNSSSVESKPEGLHTPWKRATVVGVRTDRSIGNTTSESNLGPTPDIIQDVERSNGRSTAVPRLPKVSLSMKSKPKSVEEGGPTEEPEFMRMAREKQARLAKLGAKSGGR